LRVCGALPQKQLFLTLGLENSLICHGNYELYGGKMSIFEAGMLICFGASWPLDIYKSIKSRTTAGKSVMFMFVLTVGYIFGIINKIIYSRDIVLVLYIINLLLVSIDICLFYRNRRLESKLKTEQSAA
jgi:hypothetical protein